MKDKKIAISFDAAWDNSDTETLKNILGERNVKTTFFVVGDWVDKYPDSVKTLSDAGHEVMNHSSKHPHMTQISTDKMKAELDDCANKIEAITGRRPNLFRPPYGDYNNEVVKTARECGYYTIQWSIDSLDWKDLSADEIYKRVVPKVKPGAIVLFHNAAKHTPEALPKILDDLISQGLEIVPISELIIKMIIIKLMQTECSTAQIMKNRRSTTMSESTFTESSYYDNNIVTLVGKIISPPELSHEIYGEKYYSTQLAVQQAQ